MYFFNVSCCRNSYEFWVCWNSLKNLTIASNFRLFSLNSEVNLNFLVFVCSLFNNVSAIAFFLIRMQVIVWNLHKFFTIEIGQSWPLIHLDTSFNYLFLILRRIKTTKLLKENCVASRNSNHIGQLSRLAHGRFISFITSMFVCHLLCTHSLTRCNSISLCRLRCFFFTVGSIKLEIKWLWQMFIFITLEPE